MGLKARLAWYDKKTELGEGKEDSQDFGDDVVVMEQLGLSVGSDINNGSFNIEKEWLIILQPLFTHRIEMSAFDYQTSFNYKKMAYEIPATLLLYG